MVPRLGFVLRGAGLGGTFRYDSGVYYAASTALLNGRLPYRDFVLLHPPGITVALAPFVAIGQLTSDHAGFEIATVAFMLIGSVNAVLVRSIALRMGLGRAPALLGGLFYAVWVGAVDGEYLIRLECLGNLLLLLGLLAYFRAAQSNTGSRQLVLAGLALGAATAVKIWYIVPALALLLWHAAATRRVRPNVLLGSGIAVALLALDGPFFLMSPHNMWHMTVTDQLGRDQPHRTMLARLGYLSGATVFNSGLTSGVVTVFVWIAALVVVAICAAAWVAPHGRLIVFVLAAHLAVLLTAPTYFSYYNGFAAGPLAIAFAAAMHSAARALVGNARARLRAGIAVLAATAVCVGAWSAVFLPKSTVLAFPGHRLAQAVSGARCVMSDSPIVLIELNALTRGLRHDCPNWIDVTGRTYGVDAVYKNGKALPRPRNPKWQRDLTNYLLSGDAAIVFRTHGAGIGRKILDRLAQFPVLARAGGFTVYQTRRFN